MNLFILDQDPVFAAQQNNDFHVRKIILESYEMQAYTLLKNNIPLKYWSHLTLNHRHARHPMTKAVMGGSKNFDWCIKYSLALCDEFKYRFGKEHKTRENILWALEQLPNLKFENDFVDWPRCFSEYKETIQKTDDVSADYKNYYLTAKRHLALWTKREKPNWWKC